MLQNNVKLVDHGPIAEMNLISPEPQITVPLNDIKKRDDKTISPIIFSKARTSKKNQMPGSRKLCVFENILSVVVQSYYKSDYEIEAFYSDLKPKPKN